MFTRKVFLSEGKCYALNPTQYGLGGWWMYLEQDNKKALV